ncbi:MULTISPECIES: S8 family serine peptidase [unclassified Streptomyces]|uniref:S8 family serine peptidase n=1 Tax=unclassified Streptomyces TaxID=2593676 RepID=UPI0038050243
MTWARGADVAAPLVVSALLSAFVPGAASAAEGPAAQWIVMLKDSAGDVRTVAAEHARPHHATVGRVYDVAAAGRTLKAYTIRATAAQAAALRANRLVSAVVRDGIVHAPERAGRVAVLPPLKPGGGTGAPSPGTGKEHVLPGKDRVPYAGVPGACVPNDPYYTPELQWGLFAVKAPTCGARNDVTVAVLDTGIDARHEDLAGVVAGAVNFSGSPTVDDHYGHGTHLAGIIGAVTDNGIGIASEAMGTRLWNVKVLDDDGTGSVSQVAEGLLWVAANAATHNIGVVNMSLTSADDSPLLHAAVEIAAASGVTLVGAAGNDGTTVREYPSGYPEVISVAATGPDNSLAYFSNRGDSVDIAAPGVDIVSTYPNNAYQALSGTSMATGFVSATAALCRSTGVCTGAPGQTLARLGACSQPIPATGRGVRYGLVRTDRAGLDCGAGSAAAPSAPSGTAAQRPAGPQQGAGGTTGRKDQNGQSGENVTGGGGQDGRDGENTATAPMDTFTAVRPGRSGRSDDGTDPVGEFVAALVEDTVRDLGPWLGGPGC